MLIEENSTASLQKLVWNTASDLGYKAYFLDAGEKIEDDHMPFLKLGVPSLDLIDFDYDSVAQRFGHDGQAESEEPGNRGHGRAGIGASRIEQQ